MNFEHVLGVNCENGLSLGVYDDEEIVDSPKTLTPRPHGF